MVLQRVVMAKLGDTMEEGTVVSWHKAEGDYVEKGDIIMSVATDKAELEVESLVEGKILKIVVGPGETVPIGTPLAYVGEEGDVIPGTSTAE
jgi:dihydrolipoamide dehydrogenase